MPDPQSRATLEARLSRYLAGRADIAALQDAVSDVVLGDADDGEDPVVGVANTIDLAIFDYAADVLSREAFLTVLDDACTGLASISAEARSADAVSALA